MAPETGWLNKDSPWQGKYSVYKQGPAKTRVHQIIWLTWDMSLDQLQFYFVLLRWGEKKQINPLEICCEVEDILPF